MYNRQKTNIDNDGPHVRKYKVQRYTLYLLVCVQQLLLLFVIIELRRTYLYFIRL